MNSVKVKITKVYYKKNAPDGLVFTFDQDCLDRPHWIYVENFKKRPRFLSVGTSKNSELIYKAFGNFFYPIDAMPSQTVQKTLMQVVAGKYDETVGDFNIKIASFLFEKVKKLNLSKNIQILDLGAGTGITSTPFAHGDYQNLTLVDVSSEMKRVALKKNVLKNVQYLVQDVRGLNLKQNFDLVISGMFFCDLSDKDLGKVFELLVTFLNKNAFLVLVEDERRVVYRKYFEEIESGMVPFNEYQKYYFIGKRR